MRTEEDGVGYLLTRVGQIHYVAKWKGLTFMTSRQGMGVTGGSVSPSFSESDFIYTHCESEWKSPRKLSAGGNGTERQRTIETFGRLCSLMGLMLERQSLE